MNKNKMNRIAWNIENAGGHIEDVDLFIEKYLYNFDDDLKTKFKDNYLKLKRLNKIK